ncbi:MAG: bifunctional nuclease family protein, partial [Acidimicrobiales bacterium]
THDLIRDLLEVLSTDVVRVMITELRGSTYYAEIVLRREGGEELAVSSRPSDAVAVAVRTGTPLYVNDELMDAQGMLLPIDDDDSGGEDEEGASDEEGATANPDELVGEFRTFLDTIRPEDFSP